MARICLICEGAYPYIVGGVSSWVHDLIQFNREHEFILLCLIPSEEFAVKKYEIPENVIQLKNIILTHTEEISHMRVAWNNIFRDSKMEDMIEEVMNFGKVEPQRALKILELLSKKNRGNPMEVVVSKTFWNPLKRYYEKGYENSNYNIFYWTYRNIFLNFLGLACEEMPEADIYHTVSTGYAGLLGALAGYRKKGRVILTEHGIYPREREEEVLNAPWIEKKFKGIWIDFFYFLSRLAYSYSDRIISLFDYNRDLQIDYGAASEKCSVIPNGVDVERFENLPFEQRENFNIGAVLRVVPIKDVKMMLKGFKIAKRRMRGAKLYLIGPSDENISYYKECLQMVKDLEIEDEVEFTGLVDVKEYYKFLDLLLLTSISEGQPLSILEGLSAGIPFVATDVGNCREVLIGRRDIGEAGIIVPPTSYIDLAEAVVKLYQNRERLEEMGKRGQEIVRRYYKRDNFIGKYRELYKGVGDRSWQE